MFRYLIVLLFLGWTGYAVYLAKDISPLTENEKFFQEGHYMDRVVTIMSDEFSRGNLLTINVNVYWGVKGIDKQNVHIWDPSQIGLA